MSFCVETHNPVSWNKQQVTEWILKVCQECEIDEDEISSLKGQNGKGLETLERVDWIERSQNHGDIFFRQWQILKEEHFKKTGEGDVNVDANSGRYT